MKKNFFTKDEILKMMSIIDYNLYFESKQLDLLGHDSFFSKSVKLQNSIMDKLKILHSESFDEVNNG